MQRILITLLLVLLTQPVSSAIPDNKVGIEFLDQVYTINLERSQDRRTHVLAEFARLGISNFKIIKATDMDSQEVQYIMSTNFVKKYPPCFRCNKKICKCANNILIKQQVGNWLSFIKVFKDVIENNYDFVLITEDDVKFTEDARAILDRLINKQNFAANHMNLALPILIRLEKRGELPTPTGYGFTKDIVMSNACFIINKEFAAAFLRSITKIDHTSDYYIQYKVMLLDPTIQHYTAYPSPAYQLSDSVHATFYSEIHPKGIDSNDLIRMQKHKKRISYLEYLYNKYAFWRKVS